MRACGGAYRFTGVRAAGRIAGGVGQRCWNAFGQIHRTGTRDGGQVRLEARAGGSLGRRRVQPDRSGERSARRRAFGRTGCGHKACDDQRSADNAGGAEGLLRQSAKSNCRSLGEGPRYQGETFWRGYDEAGRGDADSRGSARASGAVDRVRTNEWRGFAMVEVRADDSTSKAWNMTRRTPRRAGGHGGAVHG